MALVHLTKATCHRLIECVPASGDKDNVGPTVNQRWAVVSCLLGGEVFSHLMLFDIIYYHRCRCEIPHLKDGVFSGDY